MHFPDEGAGGKCNKELLRFLALIFDEVDSVDYACFC